MENQLICGDCLEIMRRIPPHSVDLIFGSPPYENCRSYSIGFCLTGQQWSDWMVEVYKASLRICKGLVAFVVQGRTRNYQWSATPALLMADLHRAGICVRNPPLYQRSSIPGSGGPDWLRSDYEWIVCATNGGRLPWSDNTAMGHPPRWGPGGAMSHRLSNGARVNQWRKTTTSGYTTDGDIRVVQKNYDPPVKANPGNIVNCGAVGGGHLGSKLSHLNEAPFSEYLVEFFIRSFCRPGGWVVDPFVGSGTTCAVAEKTGRMWTGIDIRQSQIELSQKRMLEAKNVTN